MPPILAQNPAPTPSAARLPSVPWTRWTTSSRFLRATPIRLQLLFFAGTFFVFLPTGLLTDVSELGATPPGRLLLASVIAGGTAVAYTVAARFGTIWMAVLAPFHVLGLWALNGVVEPLGTPLIGDALRARLGLDVLFTVLSLIAGFSLLSTFIRREGSRHGRLRAEVELARQIHGVLVPALARRSSSIEVRGVSAASGEVGGDLVDVVETDDGWTAYVVDVSGHGVGSGLLMGMVKSAARVALRRHTELGPLLTLLNAVIHDLRSPAMYATFAGLQWRHGALAFALAAHVPVLRLRRGTSAVEELSMNQLPIAMFADTAYTAVPIDAAPGDLFVILTDGLTEVFDRRDQEFGLERMKALVAAHGGGPLEALEARILEAVRAHGTQQDDQSLLLVRVL
jgi:serine phosphatase RsbU (regulator of sigma subunit)